MKSFRPSVMGFSIMEFNFEEDAKIIVGHKN